MGVKLHVKKIENDPKTGAMVNTEVVFHCPGCKCAHFVRVHGADPVWSWNGSIESPTFSPSLLAMANMADKRCHSFVKDGKIQFLNDCFHELAGQTVDIPDWD
jgi:hypothetical protein